MATRFKLLVAKRERVIKCKPDNATVNQWTANS